MENQQIKENLSSGQQWHRLLYMLLFGLVLYLVMSVLCVVIMVQVVFSLITGSINESIGKFSVDLAQYINQIVLFLTYNENRKPYPFNPWENEVVTEADKQETIKPVTPEKNDKPDDNKPTIEI